MSNEVERRSLPSRRAGIAVVGAEGTPKRIEGYGAVYYDARDEGTEYWLWDDFVERILPGAFDRAIKEDDCRALFNHDVNQILGRNTSGTLTLSTDKVGLKYSIAVGDTQAARDVLTHCDRGDVSGSSFSFRPLKTVWREEDRDDRSILIREIEEVELYDVGPVTFPAYASTSAGVRGRRAGRPIVDSGEDVEALRKHGRDQAAWREYVATTAPDRAARLRDLRISEIGT